MPLTTIITPSYNPGNLIFETHRSILSQTYQNWEWLVIDDGSNDNSTESIQNLCKYDDRIKFYKRTSLPKGASACRNIGIENAKGDYILFLDADDLLNPNCLKNRIMQMRKNPGLDFGVFNMGMFKNKIGDSTEVINKYCDNNEDYLKMFLTYQLPWPITSPLWKRKFIQENNIRFSEYYQRLQDPEFHSKILLCYKPKFKVFSKSNIDCFYRQPQSKNNRKSINSIRKTTESINLYYKELYSLLKQHKPEHILYLDRFTINIFHSILFYTKLSRIQPVTDLYLEMNRIRKITKISVSIIWLFASCNMTGVTFIKGFGVSRLWNQLFKTKVKTYAIHNYPNL